ncbi:MAG TPA: efflux RND transporter periplasmic adaptor subunit [Burkholderiales bacterium]|nr:efflux RND transporter periplasmic adaptor subunit [Burkholderiales bacterium]
MEENGKKRKHMLLGLGSLFLVAGAAYSIYWFSYGQFYQSTDDSYVSGNLVALMPQITGNVVSVYADDTESVKAGQPLVKLDGTDAELALQNAETDLAETVRRVKQLYSAAGELRALVNEKQSELEKAKEDLSRRRKLILGHAVSKEDLQHAKDNVAIAESSLASGEQKLASSLAAVENTTLSTHPAVLQAETRVRQAWLEVARIAIKSPATGYVAKRSVQIGERVTPASTLMVIVPLDEIWVDANFKEDQLRHIRIGQPVTLTSDIYGRNVVFHGKVAGLGAGTGSVFSLLPPQNATGNWIKVIQRLPVRIRLDSKEIERHPLRIGLSMLARVDTHDESGAVLAKAQPEKPIYSTSVFENRNEEVERVIEKILRENG